jgi:hypothetical protein
MKQEELQFKIDQLRKDKIIYAIEACAINLMTMVLFLTASLTESSVFQTAATVSFWFSIIYMAYMGVGNFNRLQKIKRLEKQLG